MDAGKIDMQKLTREAAAGCLGFNVRRASRAVAHLYDVALEPCGLKGTQFSLLNAVYLMGSPTMNRLAEVLGMDRTTLTRNLGPLERDGLVETGAGDDRRMREIRLSGQGRDRLREALPRWQQAHRRLLAALGEEGAQRLLGDLATVIETARDG